MKKSFLVLLILLFFGFSGDLLAGGGWVNKKGGGYFKLAQNAIYANYYFGPNGDLVKLDAKIGLYTTSLYGEYGLTDNLTAIVYMPFFVRSTLNNLETNQTMTFTPGDEINTFGDTDLTLKYGFFQDKAVVMSASLTLGFPFGHSEVTSERILQTGDGEFNQMVKLEASHSFYPAPVYATVYGALNNRTRGFSDEYRLGGEVGLTLDPWLLALKVDVVQSFFNGDDSDDLTNNASLFANNIEYFSFTPEVNYIIKDQFGVSASAGFAFSGKRILASPNFGLGLFLKL